jgi:hypothetical protein
MRLKPDACSSLAPFLPRPLSPSPPCCRAPGSCAERIARGRYDLLLYLLDASKAEIEGTRMSIDFYVDPEAEEPYAGEVSVGCSSMPKVRCQT